MPSKEIPQSEDEKQQEQKEVQKKKDELGDDLLSSLDLPSEEEVNSNHPIQGGKVDSKKREENESVNEEKETEEDQEENQEEDQEQEDADETEDDQDDELIPKSKMLKRIEREKAARRAAEERLAELEAKQSKPSDPRRAKLEEMSIKELKTLKRQALREFKSTDDPEKEEQLLDLQEEIDEVIRTAPQRFQESQLKEYEKAVKKVVSDPRNENIDFDKDGTSIRQLAVSIYNNKDYELQKLKKGQAIALEMAVDHYREISKYTKGKSKETSLKRQITKLKRKTSLDSGMVKGDAGPANLRKLKEKAVKGDHDDKLNYISEIIDIDKYFTSGT